MFLLMMIRVIEFTGMQYDVAVISRCKSTHVLSTTVHTECETYPYVDTGQMAGTIFYLRQDLSL